MFAIFEFILVILGTVLPCLAIIVILGILIVVTQLIQQNRQKRE